MIDTYLTQTMTVRAVSGRSLSGDPILVDTTNVKCRVEYSRQLVRNQTGTEVTSEATVFTTHPVKLDDVLVIGGREWPIISISSVPDLSGSTLFREVSL